MSTSAGPKTLYDKIWDKHVVRQNDDGTHLIYIDRHLVHEVTSPQAFEGLGLAGRKVRRPDLTLAVPDHNVPTSDRAGGIANNESRIQVETLMENCAKNDVPVYGMNDPRQGIVHIIGPERGLTQPGMTVVCGDSHTATHGAFGALAFGIGTSEVEHVLATQTLPMKRPANMRVTVEGALKNGVTAKDLILAIIGQIGTAGGTGHVMRTLALAQEWISRGGSCLYFSTHLPDALKKRLEDEHCQIQILPDDCASTFSECLAVSPPRWLLIDGYDLARDFQKQLITSKKTRIAVISDHGQDDFHQPDLIIHANIEATADYTDTDCGAKILAGPDYILLRNELQSQHAHSATPSAKNILVSMGGSDPSEAGFFIVNSL